MTTRGATPTHRSISAAVLIAVLVVGVATPSAVATTTYRYWSYWIVDAGASPEWGYASEGAGTRVPADGSVEGWRFGLAGQVSDIKPSVEPDFESICAGTERQDDTKRVGIVIDPEPSTSRPTANNPAHSWPPASSSMNPRPDLAIAQAVADVRVESGFVCGIDGYPASECAPLVEVPTGSRADDASPDAIRRGRQRRSNRCCIRSCRLPRRAAHTRDVPHNTARRCAHGVGYRGGGLRSVAPLSTGGGAMTAPTVTSGTSPPLCPTSHETTGPDGCTRWPGGRGLWVSRPRPA